LLLFYIRFNDRILESIPERALKVSLERCTPKDVLLTAQALASKPVSIDDQIPTKTGRRYIVVGGAGFLGGWIVLQLIQRGENPKNIRVLDIRLPSRMDLKIGDAKDVDFRQVDVSDALAAQEAFEAPWPSGSSPNFLITVFHTAANIRFYERIFRFVPRSSRVNVDGTQNIINSSRSIGVSTLIYTSSGSIGIFSSRYLLWPWESEPAHFVHFINDSDDTQLPERYEDFFSNYAYTKHLAEKLVRKADKTPTENGSGVLRTGCIRPGNGVFGPGGDMLCGAYLVRQTNPTWIANIVSHFVYVENCALAHLLYEQRMIDLEDSKNVNPDIGGQAFVIADPGPPPTYGDVYTTLNTLSNGETYFPNLSPTVMLLLAYVIEFYYISRDTLVSSIPFLASLIPPINGDLINLQPSLYNLTMTHLIFDDSRARLPPSKGGLGYKGGWTTLEGLHKTAEEHYKRQDPSSRSGVAGISF
ncbi:NAD-P-binding protein, partial [Dendrothele bispora CBS 962.96]